MILVRVFFMVLLITSVISCGATPTDNDTQAWIQIIESSESIKVSGEEHKLALEKLFENAQPITVKQRPSYTHEIYLGNQHWKINLSGFCEKVKFPNQYYRVDSEQLKTILAQLKKD